MSNRYRQDERLRGWETSFPLKPHIVWHEVPCWWNHKLSKSYFQLQVQKKMVIIQPQRSKLTMTDSPVSFSCSGFSCGTSSSNNDNFVYLSIPRLRIVPRGWRKFCSSTQSAYVRRCNDFQLAPLRKEDPARQWRSRNRHFSNFFIIAWVVAIILKHETWCWEVVKRSMLKNGWSLTKTVKI